MANQQASMSIALPGVDFGEMARQAIAVKLTEALVGADQSIIGIVAAAMDRKVSPENGNVGASYQNTIPYVEWLAQDLIRKAALDALVKKVEALKPQIEAAIEKQLLKDRKRIASVLAQGFLEAAQSKYYVKVNIGMTTIERER
jgi:Zn-dependent oligopeptidase